MFSLPQVTIFGERCSGTNYLEKVLTTNFEVQVTWQFGWKHFYGHDPYNNSDNTLFVGIVRDLVDWCNSLYRMKYHLPPCLTESPETFFTHEWYSVDDAGKEILQDRHWQPSHNRYPNVFAMRREKIRYLREVLPLQVQHCHVISYENLVHNFDTVMRQFTTWLRPRSTHMRMINLFHDVKSPERAFRKKPNLFSRDYIQAMMERVGESYSDALDEVVDEPKEPAAAAVRYDNMTDSRTDNSLSCC